MGRRKKYTPAQLEREIDKYFKSISYKRPLSLIIGKETRNQDGEEIIVTLYATPPTISGLCLALGINRDTWAEYCKREGYTEICADARLVVECYLSEQLVTRERNVEGIKFTLANNFGWSNGNNRHEIELGEQTRNSIEQSNITMADKMALIAEVYGDMNLILSSGQTGTEKPISDDVDETDMISDDGQVPSLGEHSDCDVKQRDK